MQKISWKEIKQASSTWDTLNLEMKICITLSHEFRPVHHAVS